MTTNEIAQTGATTLRLRLAVVEYSTIARQAAEAEAIKAELAARQWNRRGGW